MAPSPSNQKTFQAKALWLGFLCAMAMTTTWPAFSKPASTRVHLNIRSAPQGRDLGTLSPGEKFTVLKTSPSGKWMKIKRRSGQVGWVYRNYVRTKSAIDTKISANVNPSTEFKPNKEVQVSSLNIRSGAGSQNRKIGHLTQFEKIEVLSETGSWSKIRTSKDQIGYVFTKYLTEVLEDRATRERISRTKDDSALESDCHDCWKNEARTAIPGHDLLDIGSKVYEFHAKERAKTSDAVKATTGYTPLIAKNCQVSTTSKYGMRKHPMLGVRMMHTGQDISTNRTPTPIRAPTSGTILGASRAGGYGKQIRMKLDNGLEISFSHMSTFSVKKGQRVTAGTVLGKTGSTGRSTGVHLHFEVKKNGVRVDPLKHFKKSDMCGV